MPILIHKDDAVPLHIQLLNEIRHCVVSGEWRPGSKMPSELTLQVDLGISRSTVRQALQAASYEGLIDTIPGKGTFVSQTPPQLRSSHLVGFVIPYFRDGFDTPLFRGAVDALHSSDYRVVFCTSNSSLQEEDRCLKILEQEQMAGYLLWPVMGEDPNREALALLKKGAHLVLMDRDLPFRETDLVISDNFNGGYAATNHLIELGHRRIAFLCRNHLKLLPIAERLRGYRQAMRDADLSPLDPVLIEPDQEMTTEYGLSSFTQARSVDINQIREYLDSADRATALFASNDLIAIQALRAAELNGLQIPKDLSVVGFDNMDLCENLNVPLTTVAQDSYKIGFEAGCQLLARIKGDIANPRQIIIPTRFVLRESTSAPEVE